MTHILKFDSISPNTGENQTSELSFMNTLLKLLIFLSITITPPLCIAGESSHGPIKPIVIYKDGNLDIHAQETPLIEILNQITQKTEIKFIYPEDIHSKKITYKSMGVSINQTIKDLLKANGIKNYVIKTDDNRNIKSIEILPDLNYTASTAMDSRTEPYDFYVVKQQEDLLPEGGPIITHRRLSHPSSDSSGKEIEIKSLSDIQEDKHPYLSPGGEGKGAPFVQDAIYFPIQKNSTNQIPEGASSEANSGSNSNSLYNMSDQYYPPGSKEDMVNLLQKMCNSHLSKEKKEPTDNEGGDRVYNMSDEYYPPD